nr:MAG TPA: Protein of unknown function (DUF1804) [Caudoviricetes sp.]
MAKQIDSTNKTARREMAQRLYVEGEYTQEEVATIIGVTRQTIVRWSKEHHWQELKVATSVSPERQIRQLRQQIDNINEAVLARPPADRWATTAESDSINKLAAAIKKLQKDVGIEDIVSVGMGMTSWMRSSDPERAKDLSNLFNAYIQYVMGGAKR